MAKIDWDKAKVYTGPTLEEQARKLRLQKEKAKIKPKRKPGMATKNQMKYLRKHKLVKEESISKVSFGTASALISKHKKMKKKKPIDKK